MESNTLTNCSKGGEQKDLFGNVVPPQQTITEEREPEEGEGCEVHIQKERLPFNLS